MNRMPRRGIDRCPGIGQLIDLTDDAGADGKRLLDTAEAAILALKKLWAQLPRVG